MRFQAMLLLVAIPVLSFGQDDGRYQCTLGDLSRRVEIMHETGVTVPCEVHYFKDSESPGDRQVLWRAQNEEGYCETKASEFISMLSGMGWECGAAPAEVTTVEEEVEPADDTDALAPSDPQG